jgi:hypothetical protein
MAKCAGLSIRVSPSHPYNADRTGLGWGGGMCTLHAVTVWWLCDTRRPSSLEAFCEVLMGSTQLFIIKSSCK